MRVLQNAQSPSMLQLFLRVSPLPSRPKSALGSEFFPAVCLRLVQFVIHT